MWELSRQTETQVPLWLQLPEAKAARQASGGLLLVNVRPPTGCCARQATQSTAPWPQHRGERAQQSVEGALRQAHCRSVRIFMQYPLYAGLNALPGRKDEEVALLDVPVDLLLLRADLRELKIDCSALIAVPEWLGELVHFEVLHLDGSDLCRISGDCAVNCAFRALSEALGDTQMHKDLTLKSFGALNVLPLSIARSTSLEALHIQSCGALRELPSMSAMTRLTLLTLVECDAVTELPCFGGLDVLQL